MTQRTSPADYLHTLHGYCSSTSAHRRRHAWLRLFTTPLPAVVAMTLTDAIPLQPPLRGLAHSHLAWVRTWVCSAVLVVTVVLKLNYFVPAAAIHSWTAAIRIVVLTASGSVVWLLWLATRIGYPLPFTINMGQPVFSAVFVASTIHAVGWQRLRSQWGALATFLAVLIIQMTQSALYPIVQFAFTRVQLPLLPFVLPLLKYCYKRVFSVIMRHSPELRPVVVVFNAEVFHALYVSLTMQTSSSGWTPALFIGIDLLGVAYMLYCIHRRLRRIHQILPSGGHLLDCALFLLRDPKTSDAFGIRTPRAQPQPLELSGNASSVASVVPMSLPIQDRHLIASSTRITPALEAQLRALGTSERKALVQETIELLHATEMFMLTEYVEVIVPVVYSIYATVISQLPNLAFYPQLRELTPSAYQRTIGTVLLYATLELATFVPLDWILRRRLGFRPMQQLTFALQNDSLLMAAELTLLLVYMVQVSLDHFGNDFTFRFKWLHDHVDQRL